MRRDGAALAADPAIALFREASLPWALLILVKPGIVLAEVLTGLAGIFLASSDPVGLAALCPILLAIALAASGAAMLNGLLDMEADKRMPRLAARCRALALVGPGRLLAIGLLLIGAGMLLAALTAPPLALLLLAVACLSYLGLYTAWLKRRSPWGVLAGAIPGALPPLIGAVAMTGRVSAPPLILALFIFLWQLPHFWMLALNCRDQYAQAGIPVLPLTHGEAWTKALTLAAVFLLIPVTFLLGFTASFSLIYQVVAAAAGTLFLLFCALCLYQTIAYRQGFIASLLYLLTIIVTISASTLLTSGTFSRW